MPSFVPFFSFSCLFMLLSCSQISPPSVPPAHLFSLSNNSHNVLWLSCSQQLCICFPSTPHPSPSCRWLAVFLAFPPSPSFSPTPPFKHSSFRMLFVFAVWRRLNACLSCSLVPALCSVLFCSTVTVWGAFFSPSPPTCSPLRAAAARQPSSAVRGPKLCWKGTPYLWIHLF